MEQNAASLFASFLPLLMFSVIFGFISRALAKDKGQNVGMWTVLGFIPLVNFFCIWYFVGASNLRVERKIDELTKLLQKGESK
jgi:preprotein translocase subunit YajC